MKARSPLAAEAAGVRVESLASDAPWAEGPSVGAEFLECAGECLDVGLGEMAREVLFD